MGNLASIAKKLRVKLPLWDVQYALAKALHVSGEKARPVVVAKIDAA